MKNEIEKGVLYVVPTPIGNLSDITYRAVKILGGCDFIACEDTRVTAKLLSFIEIKKPLLAYHEHNKETAGAEIIKRLQTGQTCAVVTDAGTPAISDPGEELVCLCRAADIKVIPIAGACAAVMALSASGLPSRRFCFEGFLPDSAKKRKDLLRSLCSENRTMIFYISPHDIKKDIVDIYQEFGDRRAALCRELTKINEEIISKKLSVIDVEAITVRGEFVLIVEGAETDQSLFEMSIAEHVAFYENKGYPPMEAIKAAAKDRNIPKNEVYKAVNIKKQK